MREAFRHIKTQRPFAIDAIVILPDHLHCMMTLPPGDADYPGRWREIKKRFSGQVDTRTNRRNERAVWQRRYYEHAIRDETDLSRHLDYLFYNPVKHGLAIEFGLALVFVCAGCGARLVSDGLGG